MAVVLAIPRLFDAVAATLAVRQPHVKLSFGWREPSKQNPGVHRIVCVPGDEAGKLGVINAPRLDGRPRSVAALEELCTWEIMSGSPAREVERAQYQVTRELFDAWLLAVYEAARGTYRIVSATWIDAKKERRFGAAIRVVLAVQAPVPRMQTAVGVPIDTGALIDVSELDVTEQINTEVE
jgi:hypothetical protein